MIKRRGKIIAPRLTTKRPWKNPRKLRHNAQDAEQESQRDRELREVIKVADQKVYDAWHVAYRADQSRSPHTELPPILKAARAAARDELRAKWAEADAEYARPLANGLSRMTRDELRAITEAQVRLAAARNTYVTELRTLSSTARTVELRRFTDQLKQP